jgi:hypothetical protein
MLGLGGATRLGELARVELAGVRGAVGRGRGRVSARGGDREEGEVAKLGTGGPLGRPRAVDEVH